MFQRVKNLWRLSESKTIEQFREEVFEEIQPKVLVKKPQQKAIFIPRVKVDPVKELTKETT